MNVTSPLSSGAPQSRRSQRVKLRLPITVSGGCEQGWFSEEAHTIVINAHGALIALAALTSLGNQLELRSPVTSRIRTSRVVHVGSKSGGFNQVGLEFAEPAPNFWPISFPPEDWFPGEEIAPSEKTPKP